MSNNGISRRARLWLGAGASVLVGAGGVACTDSTESSGDAASQGDGEGGQVEAGRAARDLYAGEGEGEGEGEGGGDTSPVGDDVEYLHRLGQVRGHLEAFMSLHRLGAHEMSMTHAKHPESELYAGLVPAFEARGLPGFATELAALESAMASGDDIEAAYERLLAAIDANEPALSIGVKLAAIGRLARTAGYEYMIGVAEDGKITNAHEYQDAYGFLTAGKRMLSKIATAEPTRVTAIATAERQIETALGEFGELTAIEVDGEAAVIHGAAARIELAAGDLD